MWKQPTPAQASKKVCRPRCPIGEFPEREHLSFFGGEAGLAAEPGPLAVDGLGLGPAQDHAVLPGHPVVVEGVADHGTAPPGGVDQGRLVGRFGWDRRHLSRIGEGFSAL